MSMPMGPESSSAPREPTRELLLAQALDVCIEAERRAPGSATELIARQPAWAHDELRRLVDLAGSLDSAAASTVMSEDFRVAARERLMQRIGAPSGVASGTAAGGWLTPVPSKNGNVYRIVRRPAGWMWRGAGGGLLAAALVAAATLSASASALPGDTLYGLKQAQEELGLRLAANDESRALALLRQADARLDETARLLNQGRTAESAAVAQRYDEVIERATAAYVVSIDETSRGDAATTRMESKLSEQQDQLQAMLQTAPEPARADLREALVATERGRALVSDPRSVERALGRAAPPRPAAAALPTMAVEDEPTAVPTATPIPPTPVPVVAQAPTATPVVVEAHEAEPGEDRHEERAEERPTVAPQIVNRGPSRGGPPAAPARIQPAPSRDQGRNQRGGDDGGEHNDEVLPAVPVIADDSPARAEVSPQVEGRRAAPTDAGGEATGGEGDGRGGNQPAVVADTRGRSGDTAQRSGDDQQRRGETVQRSGDDQQRSGENAQRSGDDRQQPPPQQQPQTDTRGRSGDDRSPPDGARQTAPAGGSPQVADNRDGKSGDDNPTPTPTPTPRSTLQPVVVSQPTRATSGDGNKEGGGDAKAPASTPVPAAPTPTVLRRQPPTPTPARVGGGGATITPKPTDTKSSGGDGNKDDGNKDDAGH